MLNPTRRHPCGRRCRPGDEAGSAMIIAMSIIVVISMLSLAVMARTLAGLKASRHSQDFQAALGGADSGVSDALFRLDQIGANSPTSVCPGGVMPCTVTNVPGSPGTKYTMDLPDAGNPNHVRVRAKGVTNGVPHAIEAIATRSLSFPFAIFGDANIEFSGTHGGASCALGTTGCISSYPTDTVTAMGTNGTLHCSPETPAESTFVYPPSGATDCNSTVGSGVYDPKPPSTTCLGLPTNTPRIPCLPATYNACPVDAAGVLNATIPAGVYRCDQKVTLTGTINPSGGGVELFIFPPSGVSALEITTAAVNWPTLATPGDARDFRIYAGGDGAEITHGSSDDFRFAGILYAPGMTLRGNGCKSWISGAVIIDNFDCNGDHLYFNYDSRITSITDYSWKTRDYTEIPSSQVP